MIGVFCVCWVELSETRRFVWSELDGFGGSLWSIWYGVVCSAFGVCLGLDLRRWSGFGFVPRYGVNLRARSGGIVGSSGIR